MTPLDTKEPEKVPVDCKQLEDQISQEKGLLIANKKVEELAPGKLAEVLLNGKLTDRKFAEGMTFSNKLTEKILAEIKLSDAKIGSGGTLEDMKLVENMNLKNKLASDTKLPESLRLIEANTADIKQLMREPSVNMETSLSAPTAFVKTKHLCRGKCLHLKSMEKFGFLLMPDFLLLSVSFLFLAYGCSVPIVYLVPYAVSVGVQHQKAAFLMSILGVTGIVGNVTFGWITDLRCVRKYRTLSFMVAVGLEGLCCMFIPLLHSFHLLVPFSILYGYFDGAYVALIPVVISDVVGPACLSSALGIVYFLHAIPYLISPPIGGWLVDRTGDYLAAFFLSGLSLMSSPLFLAIGMLVQRCWSAHSYSSVDAESQSHSLENGPSDGDMSSSEEPKLAGTVNRKEETLIL